MHFKNILTVSSLLFSCSLALAQNERLGPTINVPASGFGAADPQGVGVNVVVDGGFEGGTPNAAWQEESSNFGTPICDVGTCGTGTGTGPNSGLFWAWFGGISAVEVGAVSQDVTIPSGTATLEFFTELAACDNSATDFMEARIDGNMVFRIQGDDASCGTVGYQLRTVDVSMFADGGTHTLSFNSEISGANGNGTNFFVDDVALLVVEGPSEADLGLTVTNNALGELAIGDAVIFTQTLSNAGPADANNAVVNSTLSQGLVYASNDCGATVNGSDITWNAGTVANGGSVVCNVTATVQGFGQLTMTASATADESDVVPANNSGSSSVNGPVRVIPTLSQYGMLMMLAALLLLSRRKIS